MWQLHSGLIIRDRTRLGLVLGYRTLPATHRLAAQYVKAVPSGPARAGRKTLPSLLEQRSQLLLSPYRLWEGVDSRQGLVARMVEVQAHRRAGSSWHLKSP